MCCCTGGPGGLNGRSRSTSKEGKAGGPPQAQDLEGEDKLPPIPVLDEQRGLKEVLEPEQAEGDGSVQMVS